MTSDTDDQIRLYRQYLVDNTTHLWRHIDLGSVDLQDSGYWATGNAWAAWGMLRAAATIMHSSFAGEMQGQIQDLKSWVVETVGNVYLQLNVSNFQISMQGGVLVTEAPYCWFLRLYGRTRQTLSPTISRALPLSSMTPPPPH